MSVADWRYRVEAHLREVNALVGLQDFEKRAADLGRKRASRHPGEAEGHLRQAEVFDGYARDRERQIHVNRWLLAEAYWRSGTGGENDINLRGLQG